MTITDQELWDQCPFGTKAAARSVMIGASVAWWLIWIAPGDARYNKLGSRGYLLTTCGPVPNSTIVATNLPGQF